MKKTAVLVYNQFCNFEISVLLEALAMYKKPITIFSKRIEKIRSEEGLTIYPDKAISDLDIDEYDSLVLPGAMDIREVIENEDMLSFIKEFDKEKKIIGAISVAPILLVKNGIMGNKLFMAGINKEELYEEGFSETELANMQGWDENLKNPIKEGYIISENILTSISYEFVRFGIAFAKMVGIDVPPEMFGLE